jgi:hypothetical protein
LGNALGGDASAAARLSAVRAGLAYIDKGPARLVEPVLVLKRGEFGYDDLAHADRISIQIAGWLRSMDSRGPRPAGKVKEGVDKDKLTGE